MLKGLHADFRGVKTTVKFKCSNCGRIGESPINKEIADPDPKKVYDVPMCARCF